MCLLYPLRLISSPMLHTVTVTARYVNRPCFCDLFIYVIYIIYFTFYRNNAAAEFRTWISRTARGDVTTEPRRFGFSSLYLQGFFSITSPDDFYVCDGRKRFQPASRVPYGHNESRTIPFHGIAPDG